MASKAIAKKGGKAAKKPIAKKPAKKGKAGVKKTVKKGLDVSKVETMNCQKVYVKPDQWGGMGAFARVPIKKGEVIEFGLARRLPGLNGHINPVVFTWSEDRTVWATCAGCAMFYNMAPTEAENNTHMERFFDEDRFVITAKRDIKVHEELKHKYRSQKWRECFATDKNLNPTGQRD